MKQRRSPRKSKKRLLFCCCTLARIAAWFRVRSMFKGDCSMSKKKTPEEKAAQKEENAAARKEEDAKNKEAKKTKVPEAEIANAFKEAEDEFVSGAETSLDQDDRKVPMR